MKLTQGILTKFSFFRQFQQIFENCSQLIFWNFFQKSVQPAELKPTQNFSGFFSELLIILVGLTLVLFLFHEVIFISIS